MVEHVVLAEHCLVAQADERGEAHAAAFGPVQDADAQSAGLGEESDVAGVRRAGGEGRVETQGGVDQAQAVGPEQGHAVRPGELDDALLPGVALEAGLGETGGNHGAGLGLPSSQLLHHAHGGFGGHADHGEVHPCRELSHGRDRFEAQDD